MIKNLCSVSIIAILSVASLPVLASKNVGQLNIKGKQTFQQHCASCELNIFGVSSFSLARDLSKLALQVKKILGVVTDQALVLTNGTATDWHI